MPMPDQATLRNRVKIAVARSIQISLDLALRRGIEATPVFWRRVVAQRVMSPAKYWGWSRIHPVLGRPTCVIFA